MAFADVVADKPSDQTGGVHQPVRRVHLPGLPVTLGGIPPAELLIERVAKDHLEPMQALVDGAREFDVPLVQAQRPADVAAGCRQVRRKSGSADLGSDRDVMSSGLIC
ncbi:hypothetical protein ACXC9Q_01310 [Kribbella sp. CWNU-51]